MKTSAQSRTLALGVVVPLILSLLFSLREVDGLASKTSYYQDQTCEGDVFSVLTFGAVWTGSLAELLYFNECVSISDSDSAIMYVCDATTGEFGLNIYSDGTCTELESGTVNFYGSCTSFVEECTGGAWCAIKTECTDDEAPSRLSPTVVNMVAEEYNDANCTDPTGNTVIIGVYGVDGEIHDGDCQQSVTGEYTMSQCHADGSYETQSFLPDDDTCSGDVWSQALSPTEFSPPLCIPVAIDGFYYGYISCTTDEASVIAATSAPVTTTGTQPPTTPDTPTDTPAPTTDLDAGSTAPTTDADDDGVVGGSLAPVASSDADAAGNTPSPASDGSRSSIPGTAAPSDVSGPGEDEESSENELGLASGAAGIGGGVAVGTMALSCAMGFLVSFAV